VIVYMATVRARPECADQLAEALRQLAAQSLTEPGCLSYAVNRGLDDPTLMVTVEEWRSPEDIQRHFETAHVKEIMAQAPALLAAEPLFQSFTRL
jgi:quinol monooxygenase YgiN